MKNKIITTSFAMILSAISYANIEGILNNNPELPKKEESTKISYSNSQSLDPIYNDFRLSVGAGYARRLGKRIKYDDADMNKMTKNLMNGYNVDIDLQYFFKEFWGLGINFNYVKSSDDISNIYLSGYGNVSKYEESNQFIYIAPTFVSRYDFKKFLLITTVGLGPLFYKNEGKISGHENVSIKKTAFALNADISGEYKINSNLGIGAKIAVKGGSISSNDYYTDDRISVSNFMVSGFLSYRLWKR